MTPEDLLMSELRDLYAVEPTDSQWESAQDRVFAALDAELRTPRHVRSRSRALPRRVVVRFAIAVAIIVLAATAAYAVPRIVEWFDRDAPIQDNVSALRGDAEPMSEAEYASIVGMPPGAREGAVLAPRSQSRVLIDDEVVGRIALAPFADGRGFCATTSNVGGGDAAPGTPGSWTRGCSLDVGEHGLVWTTEYRRGVEPLLYGYAADAVVNVEVLRSDGSTDQVTLRNNVFFWQAPTARVFAASVRFSVNGERHERDVQPPAPELLAPAPTPRTPPASTSG